MARHSSEWASGEIIIDAAKMLWHLYGRDDAIVVPLQGQGFLDKLAADAEEAAANKKKKKVHPRARPFKSLLRQDEWKITAKPPPPPGYNVAEAALNAFISMRDPDTLRVAAASVRLALGMERAGEYRRALQVVRGGLSLIAARRIELMGQVGSNAG